MKLLHPFLPLHPLQPGAMRGDGAAGLKKQIPSSKDATHCCGSAGIYNITQPEQAEKLQREKIENIEATGAELVATANPGCHLQIENGLGKRLPVRHPVSLLAEAYRAEKSRQG